MADATSTVTVDGVEPSILVKLLNTPANPERVKIFTDDDGTYRYLVKGDDESMLVTPADLAVLGGVGIEFIETDKDSIPAPSATEQPAGKSPGVVNTPVNSISPGQSGQ